MIRFIVNFILFGLLFYALWLFAPDFFAKLAEWAGALFTYVQDFLNNISGRLKTEHAPTHAAPALLFFLEGMIKKA